MHLSRNSSYLASPQTVYFLILCFFCCLPQFAWSMNSKHEINIQSNLVLQHHTDTDSWLNGGLGRYDLNKEAALNEIQLGYRYKPSANVMFFTHIQSQLNSEADSADNLGLVEFKFQASKDIDWNQRMTLTLGQFFLPISMENSNSFWDSPYTIHFSSLNSWIGEEFRPIGLDFQYSFFTDKQATLSAAATVFGGNDSMGALLAYRGWSLGRQRTALGDLLSLPELESINNSGAFAAQRHDGTRPFGHDLDQRPGYAIRTQYLNDQLLLSASWIDNRGDRELHRGEYAWDTRFGIIGAAWLVNDQWELLMEYSQGKSTMGAGPGVDIRFYSTYIMSSYLIHHYRVSLRLEQFGSDDLDTVDNENNDLGRALTMALFWQPEEGPIQLGIEAVYLNTKRQRTTVTGLRSDPESYSLSGIIRYQF